MFNIYERCYYHESNASCFEKADADCTFVHNNDPKAPTQQSGRDPWARVLLTDLSHITITMATGRAAMATASSLSALQLDARVLAARVTIRGNRQVSLTFPRSTLPSTATAVFLATSPCSLHLLPPAQPVSLPPSRGKQHSTPLPCSLNILLHHILHFTFQPKHTPNLSFFLFLPHFYSSSCLSDFTQHILFVLFYPPNEQANQISPRT